MSAKGSSSEYDVVAVVMDCARAKNFGFGGAGPLARTPNIDALARRGCVYTHAVSPSNWTIPSHASIFTGKYPWEHGLRSYYRPPGWPETVATRMHDRGYRTILLSENVQLLAGYGLKDGFDVVLPRSTQTKTVDRMFGVSSESKGLVYSVAVTRLLSRVPPLVGTLSWPSRVQEVKFKNAVCSPDVLDDFQHELELIDSRDRIFAFLNFIDTHNPYRLVTDGRRLGLLDRTYLYSPRAQLLMVDGLMPRVRWAAMVRGYVESIEAVDRKIGVLIQILSKLGRLERTLVIITSDHGQQFGEMGIAYHASGASNAVMHVPLVVAPPRDVSIVPKISRWTSVKDVHDWILAGSTAQFPIEWSQEDHATYSGSAPTIYSEGAPISDANRSMRGLGRDAPWNHRLIAAFRGDDKYVMDTVTGGIAHWHGTNDPDVLKPELLAGDSAEDIRAKLFAWYTPGSEATVGVDAAGEQVIDQRLRSWGYD